MARTLFSASWHSVAALIPQLSSHAKITRHVYRKQVWHVIQDQSGGRYHRLSPNAYHFVKRMDGLKSVSELWQESNETQLDACTQTEIVDLLIQLHTADLLIVDTSPDTLSLFERYKKKKRQAFHQWILNPMSIKLPLYNPDHLLSKVAPYFSWCLTKIGVTVWLLTVLPAVLLLIQHRQEITQSVSDQILSSSNLFVLALVFPIVKLLHELGHGITTKIWGGCVPQIGVMFLVFAPVPYIDASSSAAFPSKYQRATVAAAGMLTELFIAALGVYIWLVTETGLIHAIAFNVIVIAGLSTLVINGNPLLRYDGYYIFTDLIEMPNLAQRGKKYWGYLWDRYVFGVHDIDVPQETKSEKYWLIAYTPLAWVYRSIVTISIILFIATDFFIFGVLFSLWGIFSLIGIPIWKSYKHIAYSSSLHRQRKTVIKKTILLVLCGIIVICIIPFPLRTQAEGVIWLPEQAILHAKTYGIFKQWLVTPGIAVQKGMPLYILENISLESEYITAQAKLEEAQARYRAAQFDDSMKAELLKRQLQQAQDFFDKTKEKKSMLVGYAETSGILMATNPQDMAGLPIKKD